MYKLIFLFFLKSSLCFSQDFDSMNGFFKINADSIHSVEIYQVKINNAIADTSIHLSFFYDEKGRLVEKREEFNLDQTRYVSTKYVYKSDYEYTVLYNNPYILYGISIPVSIESEEYHYISGTGMIDYIISKLVNGITRKQDYIYLTNGLIKELNVFDDDNLINKYFFKYEKRS